MNKEHNDITANLNRAEESLQAAQALHDDSFYDISASRFIQAVKKLI